MNTTHLVIICLTALVAIALVAGAIYLVAAQAARTRLALARLEAAARIRIPEAGAAPARVGHRVTVHTKKPDDQTIFGVVAGDYKDRLVLEDAEYVTPQGGHPLPGRQDIRTQDIAWVDVHALVAPTPATAPVAAPDRVEVI